MLDLHTLLLASAESESSHTSFYVLAGILAGWAVLISIAGIARHRTFPRNQATLSGIIVITLALVVGTLYTAVVTG